MGVRQKSCVLEEIIPDAFASLAISSELMIGVFSGIKSNEEVVLPIPYGPATTYNVGITIWNGYLLRC